MKKLYHVELTDGTKWQSVVKYYTTSPGDTFMKFEFGDGTELLLPIKDIKYIQQIN